MRITIIAFLALSAAAQADQPFAFTPEPDESRAYTTMKAVCQLRVGKFSGSGMLVGTRDDLALVLSCRHVCERAGNEVVVTWPLAGGQQSTGVVSEIVYGDGFDTDLALVICKRPKGVEPVVVGQFDPESGPWFALGWRAGLMRLAIADEAVENKNGLIISNAPFVGGMSGGGLFDSWGHVVGVVVASDRTTIGVSVDGPQLDALLDKYRRNLLVPAPANFWYNTRSCY